MENRAGFFAEAGIRGILDRGGEESAFQRVVRVFMFPASILFFFLLYKSIFLHHSWSTLLHSYNLHLLDWMRLGGRRGGEGIEVVSDFVIQKLLALQ